MCGPLYWMIVAAGMMFMGMYALDEKSHARMMDEIRSRRADPGIQEAQAP